jgi:putative ABC transport system ATP-binding protein
MIDISHLDFSYGPGSFRLCVEKFTVAAGDRAAVIGPSGSGKTTLLHLIAGILVPEKGIIRVNGCSVSGLGDAARRVFRIEQAGLVFQEFDLLEYLTVLDNILLPYRITNALSLTESIRERAKDLSESVGVGDKLGRRPGQLSHGERQRVAICRALITKPKLLLADEPTGNLDPENKRRVVELLHTYAEENGITLLMVTHDHNLLDHFDNVVDFSLSTSDRLRTTGSVEGQPPERNSVIPSNSVRTATDP